MSISDLMMALHPSPPPQHCRNRYRFTLALLQIQVSTGVVTGCTGVVTCTGFVCETWRSELRSSEFMAGVHYMGYFSSPYIYFELTKACILLSYKTCCFLRVSILLVVSQTWHNTSSTSTTYVSLGSSQDMETLASLLNALCYSCALI